MGAAAASLTGTSGDSVVIMMLSKTPTPPGTWLITPTMVAAANSATNMAKSGLPAGSSTHST